MNGVLWKSIWSWWKRFAVLFWYPRTQLQNLTFDLEKIKPVQVTRTPAKTVCHGPGLDSKRRNAQQQKATDDKENMKISSSKLCHPMPSVNDYLSFRVRPLINWSNKRWSAHFWQQAKTFCFLAVKGRRCIARGVWWHLLTCESNRFERTNANKKIERYTQPESMFSKFDRNI